MITIDILKPFLTAITNIGNIMYLKIASVNTTL